MAEQSVYAAPEADLAPAAGDREYPGIRRLPYFGWGMALNLVYMGTIGALGPESSLVLVPMLLVLVAMGYLVVQRLRNTGSPGWHAAGIVVPVLNIYIGLRAMAFPEGYADHRSLDTPAKVIIGLFVGSMVLGIAAAVLVPMMVGGGA